MSHQPKSLSTGEQIVKTAKKIDTIHHYRPIIFLLAIPEKNRYQFYSCNLSSRCKF